MAVSMAQQEDVNEGKLSELVVAQLCKTRMCGMFLKGKCTAKKCRFAHSPEELRAPLDLTKTAMCRMFARGACDDKTCKFAHGEQELRVTSTVYKTQLCNFFQRGFCKKGVRCRHAHGEQELRSFETAQKTGVGSPPSEASEDVPTSVIEDATLSPSKAFFPSGGYDARDVLAPCSNANSFEGTPPHSSNSFDLAFKTPEKVLPIFPGLQRPMPQMPKMPEPMKVALHTNHDEPSPTSASPKRSNALLPEGAPAAPDSLDFMRFGLVGEPAVDQMACAAHIAKIAELEFQAAQRKAHQQMRVAAEIAAAAQRGLSSQVGTTTAPLGTTGVHSQMDDIMEILRKSPVPLAPSNARSVELGSNISSGSSSSKDVPPNVQPLRSSETGQQKSKTWLI